MYRLIIILVLLIILFFMVRSAVREFLGKKRKDRSLPGKDVMVQDPVCKLYIPMGSAVGANIGGQTYYFCSQDCAKTFEKQLSS